jgi:hypothetical protein
MRDANVQPLPPEAWHSEGRGSNPHGSTKFLSSETGTYSWSRTRRPAANAAASLERLSIRFDASCLAPIHRVNCVALERRYRVDGAP